MYNTSTDAFWNRVIKDGTTSEDVEADRDPYVTKIKDKHHVGLIESTIQSQAMCNCKRCKERLYKAIQMEKTCCR